MGKGKAIGGPVTDGVTLSAPSAVDPQAERPSDPDGQGGDEPAESAGGARPADGMDSGDKMASEKSSGAPARSPEGERKRTGAQQSKQARAQEQALDLAIGQIRKKCGQGAIMYLGADYKANVQAIPTGVLSLDYAIGVGGVPRGRIVEVFGPESSGKTTLTLHVIANAQREGGTAAFIDAEHGLDPGYARKLGVNLDTLLVSQPDSGEQALEIAEMLIQSNAVSVVVVDSVAALVPRAELEGEMGDAHLGLQARLMSQALRKLTAIVHKSNTCLIFINQIREKIGVLFGNPETTTGGRALKFYASVRLDIRRLTALKDGDRVYGHRTRVKVVKNKVAPPFREAEFDVLFDRGVSKNGDLLDLGVQLGILQRSGTWHSYGDIRLGQGRERAIEFLDENPDLSLRLENELRQRLGMV